MHIELSVSTNNDTIIKALIVFAEGIFEGETLIGYSNEKPTSRIVLPFKTPKTVPYDVHLKVIERRKAHLPSQLTLSSIPDSRWLRAQQTISRFRIDASTATLFHVRGFGEF